MLPTMIACLRFCMACTLALLLGGCAAGYYMQAVTGHLKLMGAQRPIEAVIAAPDTPPELAARLQRVAAMRRFAVDELDLADNGSYTRYVSLERDAVLWNVVAVPEFSLRPHRWCLPVAGCVTYRGYFSPARARATASRLTASGYDTVVVPVTAYSTLGWFEDPLISTMLRGSDTDLASTIFHELAHQRLYVPGDTAFNEAFATAVEQHGTRRWLQAQGDPAALQNYELRLERRAVLDELIAIQRERLQAIYAAELDAETMRREKALAFARMRDDYVNRRTDWAAGPNLDAWFNRPLNNAHVMAVAAYRKWLPAFERLLQEAPDLAAFYARAEELAGMESAQRQARLAALAAETGMQAME